MVDAGLCRRLVGGIRQRARDELGFADALVAKDRE